MTEQLIKIVKRSKKRLGLGYGSGKGGHTVGRGQKGQKARGKVGILFEGMKMKKSQIKKLPFLRGKGKKFLRTKPIAIALLALSEFPAGSKVDLELLIKSKIVDGDKARRHGVKILGSAKVKKMEVFLPVSKSAAKSIEDAGGKVIKDNS
jgi:large subunit ribosomal protein L15